MSLKNVSHKSSFRLLHSSYSCLRALTSITSDHPPAVVNSTEALTSPNTNSHTLFHHHSSYSCLRALTSDHPPAVDNSTETLTSPNPNSRTLFHRIVPVSVFTPFSPAISTSPRSYTGFLVSRKYDLIRRCYVARFPGMRRPIPSRPPEAMDHNNLDQFHASVLEVSDTDAITEGAVPVTELKFAVTRAKSTASKAPVFKVHNLRAAVELNGEIVHIVRTPPKKNDPKYPDHVLDMDAAVKTIKMDLKACNIEPTKLEELWYEEGGDTHFMWGHGMVKHSSFSSNDVIEEYGSKTYYLAEPVLKGREGNPGLGEFLLQEGFEVGEYYDVATLMVSLKKFFGVDVYPTFVGHGGYHPSLFEIGLLLTKDSTTRLDHPMAKKIPNGKFLMRNI